MAGSLWELLWDLDAPYPTAPTTDYTGGTDATANRASRGGSWMNGAGEVRTTLRDTTPAGSAYSPVGVRCAKSAP
jgi:formylglycine-generating enzyme required for sulfatase activity